jgi:ABC-type phosphate/phosphonate transport system permease subunit
VTKAAWLIAIVAVTAVGVVGFFLLTPRSTVPRFSCTSGNVIDCATQGFQGILSLFSGYLPQTIAALAELLVIALGIAFIAVLFYGLKKSREEDLT